MSEDEDQVVDPRYPGGVDAYRAALLLERERYESAGKADRVAQVDACLAELTGGERRPATPASKARTATSTAARGAEKRDA